MAARHLSADDEMIEYPNVDGSHHVSQQITRPNIDIQPTLTIRPGFELRASVYKDLNLPPVLNAATPMS
jgi:type IV secretory pathway VirB10-like protein